MLTGPSTRVYFMSREPGEEPQFDRRHVPELERRHLIPYKPPVDQTLEQTLERTTECLKARAIEERHVVQARPKRIKPDWKTVVNNKRQAVRNVIEKAGCTSIKDISKTAKVTQKLAKQILCLMAMGDDIPTYDYNNRHTDETINQVDSLINDRANRYATAGGIKRQLGTKVSKKFIRRRFLAKGYVYKRLRKTGTRKLADRYRNQRVDAVYSTVSQGFQETDNVLYFLDEIKFPLSSTGGFCWMANGEDLIFNDRDDNLTLHAIAICDSNGFTAFQIFLDEINSVDVLYFVTTFLNSRGQDKQLTIILDNAAWHNSHIVQQSPVFTYFLFNSPRFYEGNLIENSFSAIKDTFRTRRVFSHLYDEVECLIDNFLDPVHQLRFQGYCRHYLRTAHEIINYKLNQS